MPPSDSEDDAIDDIEFDRTTDGDDEVEEELLESLEGDLQAAAEAELASEGDDDSDSEDSDDDSGPEYGGEHHAFTQPAPDLAAELEMAIKALPEDSPPSPQEETPPQPKSPSPPPQKRPPSPAGLRKLKLLDGLRVPRSYTVEAVCAIPHPTPTHSLASSLCMTHLLTGSDDGYIRDYDIFSAVNGKIFLTAPQRHHCGVMEGIMKAAQIKAWWENPADMRDVVGQIDEVPLSAPYSLLMHSDALWALSGSEYGHINLFTVRHDPGRLCHVMSGHRGPISAMAMQHDERGFFSAGWDSEALQWDLNTGQIVRNFKSHGSQLTAIAVRPLTSDFQGSAWGAVESVFANIKPPKIEQYPQDPQPTLQESQNTSTMVDVTKSESLPDTLLNNSQGMPNPPVMDMGPTQDDDSKSDTSFDPLFDDEPDADGDTDGGDIKPSLFGGDSQSFGVPQSSNVALPSNQRPQRQQQPRNVSAAAIAPKNAPPVLDPVSYATFSPDILMVASIDGQIVLWDKRVHSPGHGVGRLWMSEKTPPWCVSACWSGDGSQIYAGRRNGTVEIYDVRQFGQSGMGTPRILKTLRNPISSGVVSCVVAFPDGRHLACASNDNIRLWNVAEAGEPDAFGKMKSGVQFKIIPGHHGGFISQMLVDKAARFLVSASSNRGWHGESTRTIFVHEIKHLY